MAPPPSIPDEISEFLNQHNENLKHLPQVVNIAFSGERKPEAWHVKLINRQVSRGFNKSAPITIMLTLKTWRKLLKKNDNALWLTALQEGQIHIHGDEQGKKAVEHFFSPNGTQAEKKSTSRKTSAKTKARKTTTTNGAVKAKARKSKSDSAQSKKSRKKATPVPAETVSD